MIHTRLIDGKLLPFHTYILNTHIYKLNSAYINYFIELILSFNQLFISVFKKTFENVDIPSSFFLHDYQQLITDLDADVRQSKVIVIGFSFYCSF